jgi:hypothetical protein
MCPFDHHYSGFRTTSIWVSPAQILYALSPTITAPAPVSHSSAAANSASSTTKYDLFTYRDG